MMTDLATLISFAKRRGFVYRSSEIYGGLANAYDYGPLGVELLNNIKDLWWEHFVRKRPDIIGLDSSILMNPKVWEASGHTQSFTDVYMDCKSCQLRTRADHLVEGYKGAREGIDSKAAKPGQATQQENKSISHGKSNPITIEGLSPKQLDKIIKQHQIPCPQCGEFNWTKARQFNLLFETNIGILPEKQSKAYLRGEIAQGMFVNFKNILDSVRITNPSLENNLPFGLAQSGKAFRNEITKGNFIFRTLEFNLAEIEYFFNPALQDWQKLYDEWKKEMEDWAIELMGFDKQNIRWRPHSKQERAHYSKHTEDLDFHFPFGWKELYGLAYRTDFDLKNHMEKSGADLRFTNPDTQEKFLPHTIEPTFGLDRTFLAILAQNYRKEPERAVLGLPAKLAPYKAAVFPLVSNKPQLVEKAKGVFSQLKNYFPTAWDARGNIGKRYLSQDEIGTPYCITIDYDTLKDETVTIRNRDTKEQERIKIEELVPTIRNKLE